MQVFSQYFKIIRKSVFLSLIIYAVIFIIMTILFSNSGKAMPSGFQTSKCNVAIINNDDSLLSKKLESYISSNSNQVKIKDDDESIRDSLFFRQSEIVITIPKGFGKSFSSDTPLNLETQSIPDSTSSIFVKNMINSYLVTSTLYLKESNITDFEKIDQLVNDDLSLSTKINLKSSIDTNEKTSSIYYFNYLAYPLLCILILGVSMVSIIFNSKYLKMRNLCSPINVSKFNCQLFLGHTVLAIGTWALFIIVSIIMYKDDMLTIHGLLLSINSLVFTIVALSISFFIGNLASKSSIYAICNCVALGSCFLGGAFVPQNMLSNFVVKLSIINPVYWYININDKLSSLSILNFDTLKPILHEGIILFAFAIAFFSMGLLTVKQKSNTFETE